MRVGKNPFKGEGGHNKAYQPKSTTVCTLTYIPNFEGYYQERFEILKISLASLIRHTEGDFDLLVFDNGSCDEVLEYLQELYNNSTIDYLFLSKRNLGYNGALNFIYSVAPGETIAYGDDDVFYHPGWLEACTRILKTFPNVGYVTGCPVRNNYGIYDSATLQYGDHNKQVQTSTFEWSEEWDKLHSGSLGSDYKNWREKYGSVPVLMYKVNETEALTLSTHFQYVFKSEVKKIFLPFQYGHLMSSEMDNPQFNMLMQLDKKLNDAGYLKLSTPGWYTEHLGNSISARSKHLVKKYNLHVELPVRKNYGKASRVVYGILSLPYIKNVFSFLYRFSFRVIHWRQIKDR